MDTTTLLRGIKKIIREVVKEELTDILREGLQGTINEMAKQQSLGSQQVINENVAPQRQSIANVPAPTGNGMFTQGPYAKILNNTSPSEVDPAQAASIMDFIKNGQGGPRVVMENSGPGTQAVPVQNYIPDDPNMQTAEQLIAADPQLAMQFAGAPGEAIAVPVAGPNNGPQAAMNNIAKSLQKDYRAMLKAVDQKAKASRPG